ncbi:hypothetical protein BDU57DRAFT_519596 [Ampelomyces quisqualis]|uniref:Uncharacterized protein n=1 Tax=Ampelomyces quisqualis TaxID=50730 RepID=A0A6A5QIM3_AMPQU|nr:hypothetical protein BDU57DRAFT_519596 [Ampelomyces quisqualis]
MILTALGGVDDERLAASIAALRTHLAEPQSGSLDMEQMRNRLAELEAEQGELRRATNNLPGISGRRISHASATGILSFFRHMPSHGQQDSNAGD